MIQERFNLRASAQPVVVRTTFNQEAKEWRLFNWHSAFLVDTYRNFKASKKHLSELIKGIPRNLQRKIISEYARRYNSDTAKNPTLNANLYLRDVVHHVRPVISECPFDDLKALYRDDIIEKYSRQIVNHATIEIGRYVNDGHVEYIQRNKELSYDEKITSIARELTTFVNKWKIIEPLQVKTAFEKNEVSVLESWILKLTDDKFIQRKLFRIRDFINEHVAIAMGIVNKRKQAYVSDACVSEWREQKRKNAQFMQMMEVVNESDDDERVSLESIFNASSAHPGKRRIELMVRCRGLEELAEKYSYKPVFITQTAPSVFHRNKGELWNGLNPKETQNHLLGQWAKARSSINKLGLQYFGVRVSEPHNDATPHWHLLLFVARPHRKKLLQTLKKYAIETDREELKKAGTDARFKVEFIDKSKGSATGYIAKYIAKNLTAENVEGDQDDEADGTLKDNVDRVVAWASRWRIRQYQFFGAASVTLWRETRRITEEQEDQVLEMIRQASDKSRWAEFTEAVKNQAEIAYEDDVSSYNEPVKKVIGVVVNGVRHITHIKKYRLERKRESEEPDDSSVSRSTVIKCTGRECREVAAKGAAP